MATSGASSGAASSSPSAAAPAAVPIYKLALIANYDGNISRDEGVVNPNLIVLNKFYGVAAEMNTEKPGKFLTTAGDNFSTTKPSSGALTRDPDQITSAFNPFEKDDGNIDYDGKIANYTTTAADFEVSGERFTNNNLIIIYLNAKKVGDQWNTVKSDGTVEPTGVVDLANVNNRIYITNNAGQQLRTKADAETPQTKYYQIKIVNNEVKIYKDGILIDYTVLGVVKTTLASLLTALLGPELKFNGAAANSPDIGRLGAITTSRTVNGGKKSKKHRKKGGKKSKKRRSMRRLKRSRARK